MDVIEEVKENLSGFALVKFENNLKKNPDLLKFVSKYNSLEFRVKTSEAPLVSVEVERSFSTYKAILTDKTEV